MRGVFKGVITMIESKNPPVFGMTPLHVDFMHLPRIEESFQFHSLHYGRCWTSTIQSIEFKKKAFFLTTRNSIYKLEVK